MTRPRARGYQRIYKACVTCRSKKTRCIVDATPGGLAGVPCNKCRRESRQCSFTSSLGSQGTLASPVPASTGS